MMTLELMLLCVRCGARRNFVAPSLEVARHGELAFDVDITGWQILPRGETEGMRHGRCPAHAIKVPA